VAVKKFSIIVATLNSERTLPRCLQALRAQEYPAERVEILIIDGGSRDQTRQIAERYGCRVLDNPQVVPVTAKAIGLREATGDYLMHVDSDEVLLDPMALRKRDRAFAENPGVAMIFATGYANPRKASFAAHYINEFGDPFSMFYYRLSRDYRFHLNQLKHRLKMVFETDDYAVFHIPESGAQPIMENAACGNAIRLAFFRNNFPDFCGAPWDFVHFFYHMQRFTRDFVVTKGDIVVHDSADGWGTFLRKIRWRIINNVFGHEGMAASGFSGRAEFDSSFRRLRKYLFIPYTFLVVPVMVDAVFLTVTRRDARYLSHVALCFYTAGTIVLSMILKLSGFRPTLTSYGERRVSRSLP
jgi:glycosyltransferase involved in cell wall biosynthesis